MDIQIQFLSEQPLYCNQVASWIYEEFVKDERPAFSDEDVLRRVKECYKDKLPIRIIAMADGICVGTAAVVENDLKSRSHTPWLAALYVAPDFRNNGIGVKLITAAKNVARDLGYHEIYLRTEHTSDYYRKLGWTFVERCPDDFNLEPDVFRSAI